MPRSWTTLFRRFRSTHDPHRGRCNPFSNQRISLARAIAFGTVGTCARFSPLSSSSTSFWPQMARVWWMVLASAPTGLKSAISATRPGNLAGYHLTDDSNDLDKWTFPSHLLNAGVDLVVFASGKNTTDPQGRRHTNFSLSGDGEYVALTNAALAVISAIWRERSRITRSRRLTCRTALPPTAIRATWCWPRQARQRSGVGGTSRRYIVQPRSRLLRPTVSIDDFHEHARAQIRYTLDGSTPTATAGQVYSAPITINKTTAVRAERFAPTWCRRTWTHRPTYLLTM